MRNLPSSFSILKKQLLEIKEKGFVPCTRPNNKDGNIGNTLEDLLSIPENNLQAADYLDYEIKSQRKTTSSAITLFSMATENEGNRKLFNNYKKLDPEDGIERLYWTIYMDKPALLYDKYECQLVFDTQTNPQYLFVKVKNIVTKEVDKSVYWDLNKIRKKTDKKMKNLVTCYAENKMIEGKRHFKYNSFECYFGFNFDKFLECIRLGYIQIDFRIGADLEGKNAGKHHDHGTGFRIKSQYISKMYNHKESF